MTSKQKIFDFQRSQLSAAGLTTVSDDALVCPLCWQEVQFEQLTIEHSVPSSVGGRRTVLTCRTCNNSGGTKIDSHLASFQKTTDALKGFGSMPVELRANGKRVAADFTIDPQGGKAFRFIHKASNPADIHGIKEDILSGDVNEFHVSMPLGYSPEKFEAAVVRAVYLLMFEANGYEFAMQPNVSLIRQQLAGVRANVDFKSLVISMSCPDIDDGYIFSPILMNEMPAMLVLFRAEIQTAAYFGAFMPHPLQHNAQFFQTMSECAATVIADGGSFQLTGRLEGPRDKAGKTQQV